MKKIYYTKSEQAYAIGKIYTLLDKAQRGFDENDICSTEMDEAFTKLMNICEREINAIKDAK